MRETSRRIRRLPLSLRDFAQGFLMNGFQPPAQPGDTVIFSRISLIDAPDDAEIIYMHPDWSLNLIYVIIKSETFDEVKLGAFPPDCNFRYEWITVNHKNEVVHVNQPLKWREFF